MSISVDGGAAQEFTLTQGTRTAADIVADLSALSGATATVSTVSFGDTTVKITSNASSITSNIRFNSIAAYAYDTLGFIMGEAPVEDYNNISVANSSGSCVVTHTIPMRMNDMPVVIPYAGGYIPHIQQWNTTSFTVDFYDYAGSKVSTPDANCKFLFRRTTDMLPHSVVDNWPDAITFWVLGVFEVA